MANGTDKDDLIHYILHLADSSLIMGHKLSEWTGHGPMLEQDIAISNIALDLIGQARNFYQYGAEVINEQGEKGKKMTEDDLAYMRDASEFRNFLITELPNGDWAMTIGKICFLSTWQFFFFGKLVHSADSQLAAIAEKSLKEVTYHLRWSSEWLVRLGDGTAESRQRMETAINKLWPYTGEMFLPAPFESDPGNRVTADTSSLKEDWSQKIKMILEEATLPVPADQWMQRGGKTGVHTEHLGYILAEMQHLQRAYPGLEW
jgi:ring-1,2-phenylacetyl-CoA epoxidase subunit PaaC